MSSGSAYALTGEIAPEDLVERYAPLVKRIANHLLAAMRKNPALLRGVSAPSILLTGHER